mmetsp:Transcript_27991/g.86748  ORF Transcript_27991/g.86748 Transcript_27991/m.86748 type:complete len:207 (+) Transcript_27991:647-1267(+)
MACTATTASSSAAPSTRSFGRWSPTAPSTLLCSSSPSPSAGVRRHRLFAPCAFASSAGAASPSSPSPSTSLGSRCSTVAHTLPASASKQPRCPKLILRMCRIIGEIPCFSLKLSAAACRSFVSWRTSLVPGSSSLHFSFVTSGLPPSRVPVQSAAQSSPSCLLERSRPPAVRRTWRSSSPCGAASSATTRAPRHASRTSLRWHRPT